MSVERKMTIARGLTRLKTIKAQLDDINMHINHYAAWNNKKIHPLGDTTIGDLKKNHAQAREKVKSFYQQAHDLMQEFVKIKLAIQRANSTTYIEIAGKRMTIEEALIHERDISIFVKGLVSVYNNSVSNKINDVNLYNRQFTTLTDETAKSALLADVLYLVNESEIEKLNSFTVEFLTEIDGIKNEVNALTEIHLD